MRGSCQNCMSVQITRSEKIAQRNFSTKTILYEDVFARVILFIIFIAFLLILVFNFFPNFYFSITVTPYPLG